MSTTPTPAAFHGDRADALAAPTIAGLKQCSRAVSALGVAVALGEVARTAIAGDAVTGVEATRGTRRACVTAAIDSAQVEVMVLGTHPAWAGAYQIGSTVLADMLDAPAVPALAAPLGLPTAPQPPAAHRAPLVGA